MYVRRLKERHNVIEVFRVTHLHGFFFVLEAPEPKCWCGQVIAEKYTLLCACVDWTSSWEVSLVRGMTHVNLSPSPFRQMTATWLREQGDWTGANAVKENWVLLEGRACEIARAEAHSNLQKAREKGTVSAYLQSLERRGHVGVANAGLAILAHESTSMREQDLRQQQDQVKVWMVWLDWEVRFVRSSWEANVTTWNLGPLG